MQLRRRFIALRKLSLIKSGRQCNPSRNKKSTRSQRSTRTRSAKKPLCLASAPQEDKRAEKKGSCWLVGGMKHLDPGSVGLAIHRTDSFPPELLELLGLVWLFVRHQPCFKAEVGFVVRRVFNNFAQLSVELLTHFLSLLFQLPDST